MLSSFPSDLSRRHMLAALATLTTAGLPALAQAAPLRDGITLSGPPAIVSAPLIHMAETNALAHV
nr:ABC transporter substrate-binding protein [Giesbergeria sp.]